MGNRARFIEFEFAKGHKRVPRAVRTIVVTEEGKLYLPFAALSSDQQLMCLIACSDHIGDSKGNRYVSADFIEQEFKKNPTIQKWVVKMREEAAKEPTDGD